MVYKPTFTGGPHPVQLCPWLRQVPVLQRRASAAGARRSPTEPAQWAESGAAEMGINFFGKFAN